MSETGEESRSERWQAGGGDEGAFRDRVTKQGEEFVGRLAQELLKSPLVAGTLSALLDVRERATRAQEFTMSVLNVPSAADLERLTRRLRSVSQRIEAVEEGLDRIAERLDDARRDTTLDQRLAGIEQALARVEQKLA